MPRFTIDRSPLPGMPRAGYGELAEGRCEHATRTELRGSSPESAEGDGCLSADASRGTGAFG